MDMSLENQIISSFIGETVHFRTDGNNYVGVLKNADDVHFIIGAYRCVSKNESLAEAVTFLRQGHKPHDWYHPPYQGEDMVIPATTTLYIFDPEKRKK